MADSFTKFRLAAEPTADDGIQIRSIAEERIGESPPEQASHQQTLYQTLAETGDTILIHAMSNGGIRISTMRTIEVAD